MSGGDIRSIREQFNELIDTIGAHDDRAMLVGELQHIINLAQHALRTVTLAEHHGGGWAAEGFLSSKRWLCHHTELSPDAAGSLSKQAKHLVDMPYTSAAAVLGVMSETRVRLLVECRAAAPELYDAETDRLFSEITDPKALALAARQWIDAARDRKDRPPRSPEFGLWLSETLDGTWRLDGTLEPGDGKLLDEAIQKHLRPRLNARRDGDPSLESRSIPELRAQALVDIADGDLRDELPERARNNRHRIGLLVTWHGDGRFDPEVPLPQEAWCDAAFTRLVMSAKGSILDVGRATRNWPEEIAIAVYTRDRHCQFPGCDIAANRCDIHHRTHWEHGGTTSLTNAILLCRRHHVFIHTHRWHIDQDQHHQAIFRQPDGATWVPPTSHRPARESSRAAPTGPGGRSTAAPG